MHPETLDQVRQSYQRQEDLHGMTIPAQVAAEITGVMNLPTTLTPLIRQRFQQFPFRDFVYQGAADTINALMEDNGNSTHRVIIWTQGYPDYQLWKIHTSGLTGLRNGKGAESKQKLTAYTSPNKINELPQLLDQLSTEGVTTAIIVDDKSDNIAKTALALQQHPSPTGLQVIPVWINQGRTKNKVPEGFTLDTFKQSFTTIEDIRQLQEVRSRFGQLDENVAWLIDFDHTLAETSAQKEALFRDLAARLDIIRQDILPAGVVFTINSEFSSGIKDGIMSQLTDGMSGSQIVKVENGTQVFVVKSNPKNPEKVRKEIRGRRRLREIGYDGMILPSLHDNIHNRENPFIVLPFYDGKQLRHAMRDREFDTQTCVAVVSSLLDIKKQLWSKQVHGNSSEASYVSMQRSEWDDTLVKLNNSLQYLSDEFGITQEQLYELPLSANGYNGHSLGEAISLVHEFLNNNPPYTIVAHNDASGGNILVSSQRSDFTIIDCEWAGPADPAEAFVRMIKHESTTTLSDIQKGFITKQNDCLVIDFEAELPDAATQVQQLGISKIVEFAQALNDPDFPRRVQLYLAGSYLREIALTPQRTTDNRMILFPILKLMQSLYSFKK